MGILNKITDNTIFFGIFLIVIFYLLYKCIFEWVPNKIPEKINLLDKYEITINPFIRYPFSKIITLLTFLFLLLTTFFYVQIRNEFKLSKDSYSLSKLYSRIAGILFIFVMCIFLGFFVSKLIKLLYNYIDNTVIYFMFFLVTITLIGTFIKPILKILSNSNLSFFKDLLSKANNIQNPAIVLLIIEIIVIVLYFVLPIIWNKLHMSNGLQLLKLPQYLNKKHTLGNYEKLHNKYNNNKTKYIYSISFWYYINPQPINTGIAYTRYTNILTYGNKPAIQYNAEKNIVRMQTQTGTISSNYKENNNTSVSSDTDNSPKSGPTTGSTSTSKDLCAIDPNSCNTYSKLCEAHPNLCGNGTPPQTNSSPSHPAFELAEILDRGRTIVYGNNMCSEWPTKKECILNRKGQESNTSECQDTTCAELGFKYPASYNDSNVAASAAIGEESQLTFFKTAKEANLEGFSLMNGYIPKRQDNLGNSENTFENFTDSNRHICQENGNVACVKDVYIDKEVKYQKWNNVVINYDGANIDIFYNGELVSSKQNISPYMSMENITIGENNGIHGAICNVIYYNRILTHNEILLNYKLLKNRKEPYFR